MKEIETTEHGSAYIGQVVLVRTYASGVHCGVLAAVHGQRARLRDVHRIWRWRGANTLSELALRGASTTEWTRISERTPEQEVLDAIELIPCAEEAADNLRSPRWLD